MANICDYGCGNEAGFYFEKAKKWCCAPHYRKCPHQAKTIGAKRIGKTHSDATKQKIGNASKERLKTTGSPFKGRKHTEEAKKKISERNKGKPGWSKGLTSDTNDVVRRVTEYKKAHPELYSNVGDRNGMFGKTHTDEVKAAARERNVRTGKWKGENNPWYGISRAGEKSPRFLPEQARREWETYKSCARYWTELEYKIHVTAINPDNVKRGIREYHIDHIVPLWYGFIHHLDPKLLSQKENLRMLWWMDNQRRRKDELDDDGKNALELLLEKQSSDSGRKTNNENNITQGEHNGSS